MCKFGAVPERAKEAASLCGKQPPYTAFVGLPPANYICTPFRRHNRPEFKAEDGKPGLNILKSGSSVTLFFVDTGAI